MSEIKWTYHHFKELNTDQLYQILQLRSKVFVVEQKCPYLDPDDKDQYSWHLAGWSENTIVAYARIIPPGVTYDEASIGRVLTNPAYRKAGLGKELMIRSIDKTFSQFNVENIKIGAQLYLKAFYSSLGFKQVSEEYLEDEIPHILMILSK